MTEKGRTIMCVIHQPSSEIYHVFDKVLLLVGGRTAFLGGVKDAKDYFDRSGKGLLSAPIKRAIPIVLPSP